jgi:hypothetical protein
MFFRVETLYENAHLRTLTRTHIHARMKKNTHHVSLNIIFTIPNITHAWQLLIGFLHEKGGHPIYYYEFMWVPWINKRKLDHMTSLFIGLLLHHWIIATGHNLDPIVQPQLARHKYLFLYFYTTLSNSKKFSYLINVLETTSKTFCSSLLF